MTITRRPDQPSRALRRRAVAVWATTLAAIGFVVLAATCSRGSGSGNVEAGAPTTVAPPSTSTSTSSSSSSSSSTTTTTTTRADLTGLGPDRTGPATVVAESVGSVPTADGSWRATGLVRNDAATTVSAVGVEATLLDGSGRTITVVAADSPVVPVAAGEQVPFALVAQGVTADRVAEVRWAAGGGAPAAGPAGRGLSVAAYWSRAAGDPRPLDMYLRTEADGDPHPYALFGSVTAGADPVIRPSVVLAWPDATGRIVVVHQAPAVDSRGAPLDRLAPGASADFLAVVDDPAGLGLAASDPTTWTVGG